MLEDQKDLVQVSNKFSGRRFLLKCAMLGLLHESVRHVASKVQFTEFIRIYVLESL